MGEEQGGQGCGWQNSGAQIVEGMWQRGHVARDDSPRALEGWGNPSAGKGTGARSMLGAGAGARAGGRWGFRKRGPGACYSACLFSSPFVVRLKKPLGILLKGLYGQLSGSNSIFFKIVFSVQR